MLNKLKLGLPVQYLNQVRGLSVTAILLFVIISTREYGVHIYIPYTS